MFSLGGLFEVMLLCVNGMAVLQVRSIPLGSTAEMEAVCLTRLQFSAATFVVFLLCGYFHNVGISRRILHAAYLPIP